MNYEQIKERQGEKFFFRFTLHQRAQHILLFSSVILLSLTGFPLKYKESWWAPELYNFFGGIYVATIIHRTTGAILTSLFIYHTSTLIYAMIMRLRNLKARGEFSFKNALASLLSMEMIPNKKDLKDFIGHIMYLLYLKKEKPNYLRMSWKEKFDYFAPYWGIPVVASAGLILWFREPVSHLLPGIVYNAAYIMHTDEVLLAAMYLSCVHWYNVHYSPEKFPMATVFLTGYLSEEEMIEEHYGEYEAVLHDQGRKSEIKSHAEITRKSFWEKLLYSIYTMVVMGFVIWYAALATRLIFHSHGGRHAEDVSVTTIKKENGMDMRTVAATGFHSKGIATEVDAHNRCASCHTEVPHAASRDGIEPILNMHAAYIACVTCHIRSADPVSLRWYDVKSGKVIEKLPSTLLEDPGKRGGYGAKIVAGIIKDSQFTPLSVTLNPGDATLDKKNHRNITKKPMLCMDCHKKDGGYIPFEALGYTPQRMSEIDVVETAGIAEKYQKIYEEASVQ